ncbi:MAG: ATP synthase F1 subunit delta [Acidobacteria bacterium]|nr:MAG: ATP synthase F1 subunit delta [Acidobacteriota bacterium]
MKEVLISTPARRYAKALLDATIKQRNFSIVLEELEGFQKLLKENNLLRQVFLNPAVSPEQKKKILQDIGKKVGHQQLTTNFLNTLIHRGRLNLLEQITVSAEQQFLEKQGIIVVEVVTARKLDSEEEKKLSAQLEKFTGKKVQLENTVDSTLLGGVITRIGTTVYDGSIQAQLEQIKTKIIQ